MVKGAGLQGGMERPVQKEGSVLASVLFDLTLACALQVCTSKLSSIECQAFSSSIALSGSGCSPPFRVADIRDFIRDFGAIL